jgi:hypothetical protein
LNSGKNPVRYIIFPLEIFEGKIRNFTARKVRGNSYMFPRLSPLERDNVFPWERDPKISVPLFQNFPEVFPWKNLGSVQRKDPWKNRACSADFPERKLVSFSLRTSIRKIVYFTGFYP